MNLPEKRKNLLIALGLSIAIGLEVKKIDFIDLLTS